MTALHFSKAMGNNQKKNIIDPNLTAGFHKGGCLWFCVYRVYIKGYTFSNTDHLTVLYLQTDFEKDVDIACRSGKQMVSY